MSDWPLSFGPSASRNGAATLAKASGLRAESAPPAKQLCSIPVFTMPGLSGTQAMPFGSSSASALLNPSIAHLVAQYGATSGEVPRPQPELRFTITPWLCSIIAGAKCRMTLATPLMLTSITASNSATGTSTRLALPLMIAALLMSRSGAPCSASVRLAQSATARSSVTSIAAKSCDWPSVVCSSATGSADRPQPMTLWPSRSSSTAKPRPMPRVTPVMTMVLATGSRGYGLIFCSRMLRMRVTVWNEVMPIGTDNSIGPARRATARSSSSRSTTISSSTQHWILPGVTRTRK